MSPLTEGHAGNCVALPRSCQVLLSVVSIKVEDRVRDLLPNRSKHFNMERRLWDILGGCQPHHGDKSGEKDEP